MGSYIPKFDFEHPGPPSALRPGEASKPPSPGKRPSIPSQWVFEPESPSSSRTSSQRSLRPNRQLRYEGTDLQRLINNNTDERFGTVVISEGTSGGKGSMENRENWGLDMKAFKEIDDLFNPKPKLPPEGQSPSLENGIRVPRPPSPPKFTSFARNTPPPTCTPSLHSMSSQNSFAPLLENRSPTRTISSLNSPYDSPYGSPMVATRAFAPVPEQSDSPMTNFSPSPVRERLNLNGNGVNYDANNFKDVDFLNDDDRTPRQAGGMGLPGVFRQGFETGAGLLRAWSGRENNMPVRDTQIRPSRERITLGPVRERVKLNGDNSGYDTGDFKDIDMLNNDEEAGTPSPRKPGGGRLPQVFSEAGAGLFRALKRDTSGNYSTIPRKKWLRIGGSSQQPYYEKTAWEPPRPARNISANRIVAGIVATVIIVAIICGAAGGAAAKKHTKVPDANATTLTQHNSNTPDLYTINSTAVQPLLKNPALHHVFPGMAYNPPNTSYPSCLTTAQPDQNAMTLDLAILTQLTPSLRLPTTDCNTTQNVLAALDRLGPSGAGTKLWLTVPLTASSDDNSRQVTQLTDALTAYPADRFAGILLGDSVLARKAMSESELIDRLLSVRATLTDIGNGLEKLPVAASEPRDCWSDDLARASDGIAEAGLNPGNAGVSAQAAVGWAWTHGIKGLPGDEQGEARKQQPWPRLIINGIGWTPGSPSSKASGSNMTVSDNSATSSTKTTSSDHHKRSASSSSTSSPSSSTATHTSTSSSSASPSPSASINNASPDALNTFMEGWVCGSLRNGTTFFWLDPFDTGSQNSSFSGALFDSSRNLKPGVVLPDCGGLEVARVY